MNIVLSEVIFVIPELVWGMPRLQFLNIHPIYIVMNTGGYDWKCYIWWPVYVDARQIRLFRVKVQALGQHNASSKCRKLL